MTFPTAATTLTGQRVPYPEHVRAPEWERFVANVAVIPGGCHLWMGQTRDGYGRFDGAPILVPGVRQDPGEIERPGAHRWVWQAWHGWIPRTTLVRHLCNEPLCTPVVPEVMRLHLSTGTHGDNADDRSRAGHAASRRYGLRRRSSDLRSPSLRAVEIQDAIRSAIREHVRGSGLAEVYDQVIAVGGVHPGQLMFDLALPV